MINVQHWKDVFRFGVLNYFGSSTFVIEPANTVFDHVTQSSCPSPPVKYQVNGTACFANFLLDDNETEVSGIRLQVAADEFPAGVVPEAGWMFTWSGSNYCVSRVNKCFILGSVNFYTLLSVPR